MGGKILLLFSLKSKRLEGTAGISSLKNYFIAALNLFHNNAYNLFS